MQLVGKSRDTALPYLYFDSVDLMELPGVVLRLSGFALRPRCSMTIATTNNKRVAGGCSAGRPVAHRRRHAHILLLADEARAGGGLTDSAIASVLGFGRATAERVRKRCVEEGIEAAPERREQANREPRKLDGAAEAKLVALASSEPPEGHARWTLKLLGERLVELEMVDSIGTETVRWTLKKNA